MARVAPPRRALGWGSGGGAICAYGDSLRFADEVLLSRGCRMHGGTVITSMCQYAVMRKDRSGASRSSTQAGGETREERTQPRGNALYRRTQRAPKHTADSRPLPLAISHINHPPVARCM